MTVTHNALTLVLLPVRHSVIQLDLEDFTGSPGGFTKGFSVGFDLFQENNYAYSSGFSFGFARFQFRKAFTQGFSSGFAKENR